MEMVEAKAFRAFFTIYSLFKSERLSSNIKFTLHKVMIISVKTYARPAWEFEAESHLLKLQRLQDRVLRTIGSFPRRTSVRDMHEAFQIPYVYDYITKSCRQEGEVNLNHENEMFATLDKTKPDVESIRGLNLAAVMCTNVQVSRLP
jgi:hypothetical protein